MPHLKSLAENASLVDLFKQNRHVAAPVFEVVDAIMRQTDDSSSHRDTERHGQNYQRRLGRCSRQSGRLHRVALRKGQSHR